MPHTAKASFVRICVTNSVPGMWPICTAKLWLSTPLTVSYSLAVGSVRAEAPPGARGAGVGRRQGRFCTDLGMPGKEERGDIIAV